MIWPVTRRIEILIQPNKEAHAAIKQLVSEMICGDTVSRSQVLMTLNAISSLMLGRDNK